MVSVLMTMVFVALGARAPGPPPGEGSRATPPWLREAIAEAMRAERLPGIAACLVEAGAVTWCDGFGWANREKRVPATAETPFLLASVSKTVTAAALMQLVEAGRVSLDADVSELLPFPVRHPTSATPITLRRLMTHSAGVADADETMDGLYAVDRDPSVALGTLMRRYFTPEGRWYSAGDNFLRGGPGRRSEYSNMGIALAGYVAEVVSGSDFAALCRRRIFAPLGMTRTSWRLADFPDRDRLAMPYRDEGGRYEAAGHYTFADYPDGGLRASARDMARFLAAHARGGRLLKAETLAAMFRPAVPSLDPEQGLVWAVERIDGDRWVGHTGGEDGVATLIALRPRDGLGLVVLANGEGRDDDDPLAAIAAALRRFAREGR